MITMICDASPLIFLAKIDQLHLIPEVLKGEVVILKVIADEVSFACPDDLERKRLEHFFNRCQITDFIDSSYPSRSLSKNDRSVLNWAIQNKPDWMVADERLLRRLAISEGIEVIGVFGLLIASAKREIHTTKRVRSLVDELISRHNCHISVTLYQRIIEALDQISMDG